jgi:hypothetical protein
MAVLDVELRTRVLDLYEAMGYGEIRRVGKASIERLPFGCKQFLYGTYQIQTQLLAMQDIRSMLVSEFHILHTLISQ